MQMVYGGFGPIDRKLPQRPITDILYIRRWADLAALFFL
jgi:hypothetical protein